MARAATRRVNNKAAAPESAEATDKSITEKLPQLVESLLNLAVGIQLEKQGEQGIQIYEQPPNRLAAEYLINRVLGKPTELVQAASPTVDAALNREMKDLRNLTIDELIQLHRKTIGAD